MSGPPSARVSRPWRDVPAHHPEDQDRRAPATGLRAAPPRSPRTLAVGPAGVRGRSAARGHDVVLLLRHDHAEDVLLVDEPSSSSAVDTRTGPSVSSTMRAASLTISSGGRPGPSSDSPLARITHHPAQRQHVRTGHVADEVAHVVVGGRADHLVRRADLDDLAVAHDQDPVAELERLLQVVGDEDHRLADLVVQPDHLVLHVPADQRVERRERLVEQHHRRVDGQRAGQPDPLLHAAGELVGVGVLVAGRARPGRPSPAPWRAARPWRRRGPPARTRRCRSPCGAAAGRSAGTPSPRACGAARAAASRRPRLTSSPSS